MIACRIIESLLRVKGSNPAPSIIAAQVAEDKRPKVSQQGSLPRWLATAAEKYDLITQEKGLARIDGYVEHGFIVNNDSVQGSIMCVGTLCVAWDVARPEDVTLDSLALLDIVRPPPELLVLGCGRTTHRLPDHLVKGLAAKGISVDVSDMPNAIATYNILSQEGRAVAAAMLPLAA